MKMLIIIFNLENRMDNFPGSFKKKIFTDCSMKTLLNNLYQLILQLQGGNQHEILF